VLLSKLSSVDSSWPVIPDLDDLFTGVVSLVKIKYFLFSGFSISYVEQSLYLAFFDKEPISKLHLHPFPVQNKTCNI
jgi:hypothetical protein